MALDAESLKYLDEAKKGKPRRFAMIMKGEKILSLFVFKKGTVDKYKKKAKEEGKGQFYHGVIDGKGQNISFKLCKADGFDKPPGKDVKLKAFLSDEAGIKSKPVYEIVEELPVPSDAADAASDPDAAADSADDSSEFMESLKRLMPDLKTAQSAATIHATQIAELSAQMKALAGEGKYTEALQTLNQLREIVVAALSVGTWQTSTAALVAATETIDSQMSKLQSKLSSTGDPQLQRIAEFGLNAVTGNHKVRLMAAVRDVDAASGDTKLIALKKCLKIVLDFQKHVSTDPRVRVCDRNPYKVKVTIMKTLGAALGELESAIRQEVASI